MKRRIEDYLKYYRMVADLSRQSSQEDLSAVAERGLSEGVDPQEIVERLSEFPEWTLKVGEFCEKFSGQIEQVRVGDSVSLKSGKVARLVALTGNDAILTSNKAKLLREKIENCLTSK